MYKKLTSTLLFTIAFGYCMAFLNLASDTDLFVLKNGYSFKADIVDSSSKYFVYKVYRGERLYRCVKRAEVNSVQYNYITPIVVVKEEVKPPEPPPAPLVIRNKYNRLTAPLKKRKGFEIIDTVRIPYDEDITHYITDENAMSAFYNPLEVGPKLRQSQIDSAQYQGPPPVNGKRNGFGTLYFDNGSLYTGKLANNMLAGFGYYSDETVDYKGMFANNTMHGLGVCYYYDSQFDDILKDVVFKGEFKDGKLWEGELYYTTMANKHFVQQFLQGNPNTAKHFDE